MDLSGLLFTTALTVAVCSFGLIAHAAVVTDPLLTAVPTPPSGRVPMRIFEYNPDCSCHELIESISMPGG